jgi:uncharacterized phage-associated protein
MSTSPQFNLSAFPHKVLDPIATLTSPPTYASIKLAQRQLSANAAAIPSLNGGGAHGHMALTLTPAAYSDLTDVPFVIPVAPPADPVPGTTQPHITENNRIHQRDIAIHSLYVAVNNALRQQLLDAIPRVYVRDIEHEVYAYSHITCLDLLTHLWTTYGTISATDLKENIQSMYKPWNPADPIETVFHQLADAIAFSIAGDDPITETAAVRAGYDVFEHSGIFPRACENWRFAPPAEHTMANLKTRFKLADTDRKRQATTGSLGYANLLSATPSVSPPPPSDALSLPFSALSVSHASAATPAKTYCWTHGTSNNRRHTSATCQNKAPGHRDDATATNTLGGSTKVWTAPKPPE